MIDFAHRQPALRTLLLAGLLTAVSATARGNTYYWQGGGGNNNWSNSGNWVGNTPPPSSLTGTDLIFGGSGAIFPSIDNPYSIHALTFSNGATAYTFDSGPLTVGDGGFTQNSINTEAFGAPVVLGADQTWTLASGSGALVFGGGVNTTDGNGTARALTINAATTAAGGNVVNASISGVGSLTKTGTGTLTLNGNSTYIGGTVVNAGTLIIGSGTNAAVMVNNAAGLQVQANATVTGVTGNNVNSGPGGNTVTLSSAGTLTNGGTITGGTGGTGGEIGGTGGTAVTLSSAGTLTNNGTITGGTGGHGYAYGQGGRGGVAVTLSNGGTLVNTGTITGGTGVADQFVSGGGIAVGFNNGGTLINSGTIRGGDSIYNNGAYSAHGFATAGAATTLVNLKGGSIAFGVAMADFANNVTLQIGSNISSGLSIGTSTAATLTLTDDGTGGNQLYSGAAPSTTFSGSLTKTGGGTWILDQGFNYSGTTTISAGTLQVGNGGTGGTLGTGTITNNAILIFNRSNNLSVANIISGTGSLTKLGAGTLTLSGASTYTGDTNITAGTLVAANTAGSATGTGNVVSVQTGATLGGGGTVGPVVKVNNGGTLDPGLSTAAARLTLNNGLQLAGGSTLGIELGEVSAGSGYSQVELAAGPLTLGSSTLRVTEINGFKLKLGEVFVILDNAGSQATSGVFTNTTQNNKIYTDAAGNVFLINYAANADGGSVANDVTLTVVPEPATWVTLAGGVVFFLGARKIRGRWKHRKCA